MEMFNQADNLDASEHNAKILESISLFSEQTEPHDDVTLITLKML